MVGEVADEWAARNGARAHALLALYWSVRAAACDDQLCARSPQPNTETRKKTTRMEEDRDEVLRWPTCASADVCKQQMVWHGRRARACDAKAHLG